MNNESYRFQVPACPQRGVLQEDALMELGPLVEQHSHFPPYPLKNNDKANAISAVQDNIHEPLITRGTVVM